MRGDIGDIGGNIGLHHRGFGNYGDLRQLNGLFNKAKITSEIHRCGQVDKDPHIGLRRFVIADHTRTDGIRTRRHIDDEIIAIGISYCAQCGALNDDIGTGQGLARGFLHDLSRNFTG